MKKTILILAFVVKGLCSSAQWTSLTTGVANNLNAIQFLDNNNGFCVGDNGCFIKTHDGGASWTLKNIPASNDLQSVYFINADTGLVCSNNHIYRTTDGGLLFNELTNILQHPLNPSLMMTEIKMSFNGRVGIITALWNGDTTISLKTNNAGNSWKPFSPPHTSFHTTVDYSIINANVVYATRLNNEYKTTDIGLSWSMIRILPYSVTGDNGFRIFNSSGLGYANCGYGTAFVKFYNDIADTSMPHGTLTDPISLSFINSDTGYYLKEKKLYKTLNGGITKSIVDTFTTFINPYKWHVCFVNYSIGFLCGENGKIYKTISGGTTSVNNPTFKKRLRIYPNPAFQKVTIEYSSDIEIEYLRLLDMNGKLIRRYKPDSTSLDVTGISTGTYIIHISTNRGEWAERIEIN